MKLKQLLLNNTLFESLDSDELDVVVTYLKPHQLDADTVVFKEGAHGNYVCFVLEGTLHVTKSREGGQGTIIASIGEGQSVGEMAIIDGLPRSATVNTASPASLLLLKREEFNQLLIKQPVIAAKMLKAIARMLSIHLRKTSGELSNLLLP